MSRDVVLCRGIHREPLDGKEGVDGSSPSEGSAKAPHVGAFSFRATCSSSNVRWVWSRLWSFDARESTSTSKKGVRRSLFPAHRDSLAVRRGLVRLWSLLVADRDTPSAAAEND